MHINDDDIVLFLDGLLTEEDHNELLNHMGECNECYLKITDIAETVKASTLTEAKMPDEIYLSKAYKDAGFEDYSFFDKILDLFTHGRFKFAFAGIGIVIALFAFYLHSGNSEQNTFRDMSGKEALQITSPLENENIHSNEIVFQWEKEVEVLTYNFIIYDTDGEIILKTSTTSNEFRLNDISLLSQGKTFLWMVEAIKKDGSKKQSQLTSFNYVTP